MSVQPVCGGAEPPTRAGFISSFHFLGPAAASRWPSSLRPRSVAVGSFCQRSSTWAEIPRERPEARPETRANHSGSGNDDPHRIPASRPLSTSHSQRLGYAVEVIPASRSQSTNHSHERTAGVRSGGDSRQPATEYKPQPWASKAGGGEDTSPN